MVVTEQVFEEAIASLVEELEANHTEIVLQLNRINVFLHRHEIDRCGYQLEYRFDENEGYTYIKKQPRKIGFIGGEK